MSNTITRKSRKRTLPKKLIDEIKYRIKECELFRDMSPDEAKGEFDDIIEEYYRMLGSVKR